MSGKRKTLLMIFLLLTRVSLGVYVALAGFAKVQGELNNGVGSFYEGPFKSMQPDWLPNLLAAPYGYALPWLELLLGVTLALGLLGTISAALVGLMIVSFLLALIMQFGISAQGADAPGPFSTNYILVPLSFLLACLDPGRLSLDRMLKRKTDGRKVD